MFSLRTPERERVFAGDHIAGQCRREPCGVVGVMVNDLKRT